MDYEMLKLMLTQIEAVYEETASRNTHPENFLASLPGFGEDEEYFSSGLRMHRRKKYHRRKKNQISDWRDELFAESDSSVAFASLDDDSDEDSDKSFREIEEEDDDDYTQAILNHTKYNFSYGSGGVHSYGSSGSFGVVTGGSASRESSHHNESRKMSFETDESRPMLENMQAVRKSSVRTGFGTTFGRQKNDRRLKKIIHRKKRNTVPKHLREAHTKARSITERFLGLLKAEVDKISLFAHARFGELTDTIGSLRFPSDQEFGYDGNIPLSDGGIHPSASSSSGMSTDDDDSENNRPSDAHDNMHQRRRRDRSNNSALYSDRLINTIIHRKDERNRNSSVNDFKTSALRQINLSEELRKSRPIFQRTEQIFGEDFTLLSAVDEAESFAAVGVELLHILRYLCINTIAIRKLCQKHDRLLTNRMLGGYYHRTRRGSKEDVFYEDKDYTRRTPKRRNLKKRDNIPTTYRDYYVKLRPTKSNGCHFLVGTYDSQVQNLCNSSSANTLAESLSMALSEFEISRRRADALSTVHNKKQNRNVDHSFDSLGSLDEDGICHSFPSPKNFGLVSNQKKDVKSRSEETNSEENDDNLSTSSLVPLTRLRFVVASIATLREAAGESHDHYFEHISRTLLSMNESGFFGEPIGLNSCSRDMLDAFATYNPDFALILDPEILKRFLECENKSSPVHNRDLFQYEPSFRKMFMIDINPKVEQTKEKTIMMGLHVLFSILSLMNYYIIVPSASSFCSKLGLKHGHSPILVGSANWTMFFAVFWYVRFIRSSHYPQQSFQNILIIASVFAVVGNILYSKSFEWGSFSLAIAGRLLVGLSSCEIISKEFISLNSSMYSKRIFKARILQLVAICLSFILGTLYNGETCVKIGSLSFQLTFETFPAYIMSIFWFIGCLSLLYLKFLNISEIKNIGNIAIPKEHSKYTSEHDNSMIQNTVDYTSITDSLQNESFGVLLQRSFSGSLDESFRTLRDAQTLRRVDLTTDVTIMSLLKRTIKLLKKNVAVPVTFFVYCCANVVLEVVLTSCAIVTTRYFMWSGIRVGFFLIILSASIVPVYYISAYLSAKYSERSLMKKLLQIMIICLIGSINFEALIFIFRDIGHVFGATESGAEITTYYDWGYGSIQYQGLIPIIFTCAISLDSLALTLLSKVSPERLNKSTMNSCIVAPMVMYIGRLIGDGTICLVSFSHRVINTDMINSISFILIFLCISSFQLIKKYFFFLQGSSSSK